MDIPEERGFLCASAIAAVCLMAFIAIIGATALLRDGRDARIRRLTPT